MANSALFASHARVVKPTDAVNAAGGVAYAATSKSALAQYAMTGCLRQTFYAGAEEQLETILSLCKEINDLEFVAKLAVSAREDGFMKDVPAFLCAYVAANDHAYPDLSHDKRSLCEVRECARPSCLPMGRVNDRTSTKGTPMKLNMKTFAKLFPKGVVAVIALDVQLDAFHGQPEGEEESEIYWLTTDREHAEQFGTVLKFAVDTPVALLIDAATHPDVAGKDGQTADRRLREMLEESIATALIARGYEGAGLVVLLSAPL